MQSHRTCSVDACARPPSARGWCSKHYKRWLRYGSPTAPRPKPKPILRFCSVPGCGGRHNTHGFCQRHAIRWRRHGDPSIVLTAYRWPRFDALAERFWTKVEFTDCCWLWTAYRNRKGYGQFRDRHSATLSIRAHRWAYEFCVGPIPDGLTIDHLCRNPPCVNPDHLRIAPAAANLRRYSKRSSH